MRHTISMTAFLVVFWLINSGHFDGFLLTLGAISVILTVWIAHRMDVVDHESTPLHLTLKFPAYFFWLFWQVVLSNIDVVKRVWLGKKAISPGVATLDISQKTDMGRVIYANSITLTPGTVSINLSENQIVVHGLTQAGIEDLKAGSMDAKVRALEE